MDARVESVIEVLRREGFARFRGVLSDSIVTRLQAAGERLETREPEGWAAATAWYVNGEWNPSYFADEGESANFYDCLGVDEGLDQAIEDVLETPEIRELVDNVVGLDRRMWFVQLRWAVPGSQEYPIHQDLYGELGLCVYLSDHPDELGSMVLWPRSHRWPRLLEGFPLLHPRWVPESLDRVDGVSGDICVFFNKTWHGRTSAVGSPRLVMLISFIPPGPIEHPRRLPESARAGLGPELQKITAPDAARSFGDHLPEDPPLSSTFELAANCPFTEEVEEAVRAYAWGWSTSVADGSSPLAILSRYKTFAMEAMLSAVVPKDVVDFVLEDFRRRAESEGVGPRTYHYLRMSVALWNGDAGLARRELDAWRDLPRDALSDAPECEQESVVRFHADLGEDDDAVTAAQPLFDGELSEFVPGTAWSNVLLPHVRSGRFEDAARAHVRGYPEVRGNPTFAREIGRHLEYLALRAGPKPALQVLCDHLGVFGLQHNTGGLWHFWSGAWQLFARMQRAGVSTVEVAIPRLGEGPFEVAFLSEHFRKRLCDLGERFDRRNGNGYRAARIVDIGGRIGWAPLPDSADVEST